MFGWRNDINHLGGTAHMGFDRETSVVNVGCRSSEILNLWVCDGSVFPTMAARTLPWIHPRRSLKSPFVQQVLALGGSGRNPTLLPSMRSHRDDHDRMETFNRRQCDTSA